MIARKDEILLSVFLYPMLFTSILILVQTAHLYAGPAGSIRNQISKRADESVANSNPIESHPLSSISSASAFDSDLDSPLSSRHSPPSRSCANAVRSNIFPDALLRASLEKNGEKLSEILSVRNLVQWTGSSKGYLMDANAFDAALSQMLHVFGAQRIGENGDRLVEYVLHHRGAILTSPRASSILESAYLWSMSRPKLLTQFLQDGHLNRRISGENLGFTLISAVSSGEKQIVSMFLKTNSLLQRLTEHDIRAAINFAKTNAHMDIAKMMLQNPRVVARMSPESLKMTWISFLHDPKAFSLFLDVPHIKAALTPETLGSIFSLITMFDKERLVQIYLSHEDVVQRTPRETIFSTISRAITNDKNSMALLLLENEAFHLSLSRKEYRELVDMSAPKPDGRVYGAIRKILHDNPRPFHLPFPENLDYIDVIKDVRVNIRV